MKTSTSIFLVILSVVVAQNPPTITPNCTAFPATRRDYLSEVNSITSSTLSRFSHSVPAFSPFYGPLTSGLRFTAPSSRPLPTISTLAEPITTVGRGMGLLSSTLLSLVAQWTEREAAFTQTLHNQCQVPAIFRSLSFNQISVDPICRGTHLGPFIASINTITQNTLGDLGQRVPRLSRLTDPMAAMLSFSSFNGLGNSLLNFNQDIPTTGAALRGLAGNLTQMAKRWDQARVKYLKLELRDCKVANSRTELNTVSLDTETPEELFQETMAPEMETVTPATLEEEATIVPETIATQKATTTQKPITTTKVSVLRETFQNISNKPVVGASNSSSLESRIVNSPIKTPIRTTPWPLTPALTCEIRRPVYRQYITDINTVTRRVFTTFGRTHTRLHPLSTSLWLGLTFSSYTPRPGINIFNLNQEVSTTGEDLKQLAQTILDLVDEWEALEENAKTCSPVTPNRPLINPRSPDLGLAIADTIFG